MIQSTKIHQKMGTTTAGNWQGLLKTKPQHNESEVKKRKKGVHNNYTEEVTKYPQTSGNTALHNNCKSPQKSPECPQGQEAPIGSNKFHRFPK